MKRGGIKHRAGCNGQEAYDEFCTLLRIENTLNRPEVFTIYRAQPARPHGQAPQSLPPNPRVRVTGRVPALKAQRAWRPLRRSVTDLPHRAKISPAANQRYLDALASTQASIPLGPGCRAALPTPHSPGPMLSRPQSAQPLGCGPAERAQPQWLGHCRTAQPRPTTAALRWRTPGPDHTLSALRRLLPCSALAPDMKRARCLTQTPGD